MGNCRPLAFSSLRSNSQGTSEKTCPHQPAWLHHAPPFPPRSLLHAHVLSICGDASAAGYTGLQPAQQPPGCSRPLIRATLHPDWFQQRRSGPQSGKPAVLIPLGVCVSETAARDCCSIAYRASRWKNISNPLAICEGSLHGASARYSTICYTCVDA